MMRKINCEIPAKEIGATPAQVALSWIADRPGVIGPIVGARTIEDLRNNLGAAELTLDDEATPFLKRSVRRSPAATPMEPLAQASARAGCRMGRQLPNGLTPLAPIIRPDAPETLLR
jgi:hypothetical protein